LVVDDQRNMRTTLAMMLRGAGYDVDEAEDGAQGREAGAAEAYDLVITDLRMGEPDGLQVLKAVKEAQPKSEVIVMTAYGTIESAVEAIRLGAFDYLQKPFNEQELLMKVFKALESRRLRGQVEAFAQEFKERYGFENIIGRSEAIRNVLSRVVRIAPTDSTVLITGESGTGKELIARAVHANSRRANRPFVPVNCAAITETLLESELFGHQRGAFTGAVDAKPGLLELGDGGSVFLDEIGELPLATQVKLLHALETIEVTRVGSTRSKKVDVRFIAATNRDLATDVQQGRFRKDLYFRINGGRIVIAPLRERQADIEPLARLFLSRFCSKNVIPVPEISSAAIRRFHEYAWPGNARELKNAMERAALMSGGEIQPRHLPKEEELTKSVEPEDEITRWDAPTTVGKVAGPVADGQHMNILEALQICAGNQTRAAKLLGISRRTLVNRLNEYSLPRPRKRVV
jgi:two-component system response regulator HydG